jgi:hypothetical protein
MAESAPGSDLRARLPGALADLIGSLDAADRRAAGALLGPRTPPALRAVRAASTRALMDLVLHAYASARGMGAAFLPPATLDLPAGPLVPEVAGPILAAARARLLAEGIAWAELDVETVVGVHEELVGFDVRVAHGDTLILLPVHVGVDLGALLALPPTAREAHLDDVTGTAGGKRLAAALARARTVPELAAALRRRTSPLAPGLVPAGALHVEPGAARRRAGAHYTPRALTGPVVKRTLGPLLDRVGADAARLLELRIGDPAMGTGAFLVEACRQLADRLREIDPRLDLPTARRLVAERCLRGVDADPLAVELARAALRLTVGGAVAPAPAHLRVGDALLGSGAPDGPSRGDSEALGAALGLRPLHWPEAFPEVMARGGFDALVGNPPWVAYAGRAAQPLADALFAFYVKHYPSFFGYRTLHGLFIFRAASLLAPGGRLGLVVPTSVSDLGGYAPTRRAHDALCVVDDELPDFGDAFAGVFQPSMGLLSTRRATVTAAAGAPWRVSRDDLDPLAQALLARLAARPPLPPACFGERGFQTTGADGTKLRPVAQPEPPFVLPIREGGDVRAFRALPPRLHLDPDGLTGRLRPAAAWHEVRVLVRQTARFPIAAPADGVAFRNSILACFGVEGHPAEALLAYLNAAPVRWLHFMRHRDARQGMPQVKIAHLRAIPRLEPGPAADLATLGEALGRRNEGITVAEQRALDDRVATALDLCDAERALIAAWAAANPAP